MRVITGGITSGGGEGLGGGGNGGGMMIGGGDGGGGVLVKVCIPRRLSEAATAVDSEHTAGACSLAAEIK